MFFWVESEIAKTPIVTIYRRFVFYRTYFQVVNEVADLRNMVKNLEWTSFLFKRVFCKRFVQKQSVSTKLEILKEKRSFFTCFARSLYATYKDVEVKPLRIRIYETDTGKRPFEEWVKNLRDKATTRRIQARLAGVSAGNLGDTRSVGEGVNELRLKFGAGYRIYFGFDGDELIILLCGGDKSTQDKDIKKAKEFWSDYKGRNNE